MNLKYIVTETKGPDSFDPIHADRTQNINAMRMLYATPLEIDRNNLLKSKILKAFEYERKKNIVIFQVRDDQKYSDGSPLTVEDVALAIARMAYYHPEFPVIKDIAGLNKWVESKKGLVSYPKGISIQGDKVIVSLVRPNANPLFRFCLELFSVIPAKCIDKSTTKLNCERAPSSGYFDIEKIQEGNIIFKKRLEQNTVDPIQFDTVEFQFRKLSDVCQSEIAVNEVVAANEIDLLTAGCGNLEMQQIHWMPSSRFSVLRFNPNVTPFNDLKNRQLFSEVTREVIRRKNNNLTVERGLFTKILPGYIANGDFKREFDPQERSRFKGIKISLPTLKQSGFNFIFEAVIEAAVELQMEVTQVDDLSIDSITKKFIDGDFAIAVGASGFWAQDPIGDLAMWLTPHLHPNMLFVWRDKELYSQIESIETESEALVMQKKMESINRYISDQALLSPIIHYKRLFISGSRLASLNLPQAVTSPAPWQIIPVD